MKISEIAKILDGTILCCEENSEKEVFSACGSDMMSDVLAYVKNQAVLLTGLLNPQTVRTAVMMDMACVVFVRSKIPTDEIIETAKENGIVIMKTDHRMYEACGLLYSHGLTGRNGE